MPMHSCPTPAFLRRSGAVIMLSALAFAPAAAEVAVDNEVIAEQVQSQAATFRVVRIVSGLEHGWALDWLPDGRMLATERIGRMHLIDGDTVTELAGLPMIDADEDQLTPPEGGNQGGLLDVAVHPDYARNGWIYFTFSSPGDDDPVWSDDDYATGTALARARLDEDGSQLVELELLYVQAPRSNQNYGWPQISRGSEYSSGQRIGLGTETPGVEPPVYWWEDSHAPSGLAFYRGSAFPEWQGNLFAGFLLAEQLSRLVLEDGRVVREEVLLENMVGRIRDVRQGPDEMLYVVTDAADGGIYRIEPACR